MPSKMQIKPIHLESGEMVYGVFDGDAEVERFPNRVNAERYIAHPPSRRTWALAGQCLYCDEHRRRGDKFLPPHDASERCESGKRNHCTCDVCF